MQQSRVSKQVDQTRSTASRTAPLRPNKTQNVPKNLKVSKKGGTKQKKRGKSITRGSGGPHQYMGKDPAAAQNRVNVKVPDTSERTNRRNPDRMSIQTLKGL